MHKKDIPSAILGPLRAGVVIPALPLALDAGRKLDEVRQQALVRYYVDAGVGGLAVGVHSTQFEIRQPEFGLYEPVLKLASATLDGWCARRKRSVLKIAGVCGNTPQASNEAETAAGLGYQAALLSLSALRNESIDRLIEHCEAISRIIPLIGFYLQPSVGGCVLPYAFWRRFAEIDNVLAVKMAPFNRYQTIDVVRAICDAGREKDILLYTGNDDTIVTDLLTEYRFGEHRVRIVGGLLGHWGFWTRGAVELLERLKKIREYGAGIPHEIMTLAVEVTDANAAAYDTANNFAGCIPGIHEMLRRQGLLKGIWCLNPAETLSQGQMEEIERVHRVYPHHRDDAFVRENLDVWLRG